MAAHRHSTLATSDTLELSALGKAELNDFELKELARALMRSIFPFTTHRIDNVRYTIIDDGDPAAIRRRLSRHPRNVHIIETDPILKSLETLTPWAEGIRRLILTDYGVESIASLSAFSSLKELDLFPGFNKKPAFADQAIISGLESLAFRGDEVDLTHASVLRR